jgi:hypothetical protein
MSDVIVIIIILVPTSSLLCLVKGERDLVTDGAFLMVVLWPGSGTELGLAYSNHRHPLRTVFPSVYTAIYSTVLLAWRNGKTHSNNTVL